MQKVKVCLLYNVGKIKKKQVILWTEVKSKRNAWRNEKVNTKSPINNLSEKHEYGIHEKAATVGIFRLNDNEVA